jgi:imidazoleglycerol-phosphate dehydratase
VFPRSAVAERRTAECVVAVRIEPPDAGPSEITTGIRMLDHLLAQCAWHGGFRLIVDAQSFDGIRHHLAEDVAIALGTAIGEALGDRSGIERYGDALVVMDDALVRAAVDLAARIYVRADLRLGVERIEDLECVLVEHVLSSLVHNARFALHVDRLAGSDPHHAVEAAFKALGRALAAACVPAERMRSTKGTLV